MVFFTNPEDIKQILGNTSLTYKSKNYVILRPWLGLGLLTNGGEAWHQKRKLLTPAFHFNVLNGFKEPMEENCKILIERLMEKADGKPFDIYPYITLFALDVICETAMGIKKNAQLESESEYVQTVQSICKILHEQSFSFWNRFNILFNLSATGRKTAAMLKVLHGETDRVIKLRRQLLKESKISSMADIENSEVLNIRRKRLAFLDILLIGQMETKELNDNEIREEVDTFMFEGHDTTSSAIGFILYALSQHPEVQEKVYREAIELGGQEKEMMPYLEAVIKETLRIYPSVPFFSRLVHQDLQIGDLNIPKGTSISTLVYLAHRDEENFPDPEKFDPDRFLLNEKDLHPFSFVAFSAGVRNCIGQKFAKLELKCTISNIIRQFEILPVEGFTPVLLAELVARSGNGIQVRLRPRS